MHYCIVYQNLSDNKSRQLSVSKNQGFSRLSPYAGIFTTLKLMYGHLKIIKREENIEKMAFACPKGLIDFT